MATRDRKGGCACGGVRYAVRGDPMIVNCCHCTSCQTETGSAFVVNAVIEANRVELLSGEPEAVMTKSESGKGQRIWRCPECKVALWSNYPQLGERARFVRVGTLDDPASLSPDVHIYVRSKLPWVRLPDDVQAHQGIYNVREAWSAASLQRLTKLVSHGEA